MLLILLVPLILFYFVYVSIIRKKNAIEEAFAGIDVQLTKRHELIPNLIETAKTFMTHERALFKEITELRASAMKIGHGKDIEKAFEMESLLEGKLSQLMVSLEAYPELKSDQSMRDVQKAFEDVEEHLAASRRFYNSSVRILNDTVEVWPMSMVASMIGIKYYPYFEADNKSKAVPDAKKIFS